MITEKQINQIFFFFEKFLRQEKVELSINQINEMCSTFQELKMLIKTSTSTDESKFDNSFDSKKINFFYLGILFRDAENLMHNINYEVKNPEEKINTINNFLNFLFYLKNTLKPGFIVFYEQ